MASAGDDVIGACCGCCTLGICAALANWFSTKPYGSGGGSTGSAGCCNSCCRKNFDEDAFEDAVRKDMEKTRDPNAAPSRSNSTTATQQLGPTQPMPTYPSP